MTFWVICTIFLLIICITLFYTLLKDNGIVAFYFVKAKEMAANEGWIKACKRSILIIGGKIKQYIPNLKVNRVRGEKIEIAFYPTGGMGDYIISSKLIEELQQYSDCNITVFCEKMMFGKSIYGGRTGVKVLEYARFEKERNAYDLALEVEHFVHVLNMDDTRLKSLAPELYQRMKYITDNWDTLYINIQQQCYRERIQFERCRLLGLNRWTELRMGHAFEIIDQRTTIPMDSFYEKEWIKLGLKSKGYITLNRGADQMREGMEQLKVWPKGHYEKLIKLCKEKIPLLPIIQLGGRDCERLSGVDQAFLGQSFELTKWIIKNSLCHIDCEGGLVHLATQLDTKCIVIFGPTPVHMYGYEQNVNIVNSVCNNCMGLHDEWAYCCYQLETPNLCMKSIEPQTVLAEIQLIKGD